MSGPSLDHFALIWPMACATWRAVRQSCLSHFRGAHGRGGDWPGRMEYYDLTPRSPYARKVSSYDLTPRPAIHIILDNCKAHTSQKVRRALQEEFQGLFELHFLPPYSPEHNPIERVWGELHDNVTRNHRCKNIEELLEQVQRFLRNASPFPGSRPSLAKKPRAAG